MEKTTQHAMTVTEAIRLRNKITIALRSYEYGYSSDISYGEMWEDSKRVDDVQKRKINDLINSLERVLDVELQINQAIDRYNKDNGISEKIRIMKKNDRLIAIYNETLKKSIPSEKNKTEKLDSKMVTVKVTFIPFMSKGDIKENIKKLKAENRRLQKEIDKANVQELRFPFSYDDVEDMISNY